MNFRDVKESLVALILCTFGDLITGVVMGHSSAKFGLIPALILLIPPSIGLRGNIYASLGSRLGSYLHTGRIAPRLEANPLVLKNISSSTFLLLVFSVVNGAFAAVVAYIMGLSLNVENVCIDLILISAISAFLSAALMIPATLMLAIGSFRWGWNPDNLTAPLITLFGDLITLPLIFVAADAVISMETTYKAYGIVLILVTSLLLLFASRSEMGLRIVRESMPILAVCTFLQFGAGAILGGELDKFIAIAGLLTVVPAFLEDGGAMGGILAARFSTMLHLGLLEPSIKPQKDVLLNFGAMHVIALVIFSLVGVIGYAVNVMLSLPTIPLIEMVLVTLLAGQLLMLMIDAMSYYFSIISFKKGLDPDNVGIPLITSFMDVLGTACYVVALKVFQVV
ncbi:MgtE integral membrane region [Archaeoglobus veneficus SNP6]|uniref:MgtE integral membrane region n=2 Tax=Archaeoglobus veneficus TaxID=58290 RepID=F2KNX3_ARCVS|nr:MgtE integral membrane region [Archaeoglobus veneficus SNP6]